MKNLFIKSLKNKCFEINKLKDLNWPFWDFGPAPVVTDTTNTTIDNTQKDENLDGLLKDIRSFK